MARKIKITAVIPTSVNIIGVAHENIVTNLLREKTSSVELPTMYRRAFMIVNETGELFVSEEVSEDDL